MPEEFTSHGGLELPGRVLGGGRARSLSLHRLTGMNSLGEEGASETLIEVLLLLRFFQRTHGFFFVVILFSNIFYNFYTSKSEMKTDISQLMPLKRHSDSSIRHLQFQAPPSFGELGERGRSLAHSHALTGPKDGWGLQTTIRSGERGVLPGRRNSMGKEGSTDGNA